MVVDIEKLKNKELPLEHVENNSEEIWVTEFSIEESIKVRQLIMKRSLENPNVPIILYICSYGGEAAALFNLLDTLDTIPNQIITVATGVAMSCGAFLLARGDIACVGPNTRVMFHRARSGGIGTDLDLESTAISVKDISDQVSEIVLRKIKGVKNKNKFKKIMASNVDVYLNPKELLSMGIIDKIGVPKMVEQMQTGIIGL